MYLCYIDESGTPDVPGNTSHFILCGISIPVWRWKNAEREIASVLAPYNLENEEFHTAWLLRAYLEQTRIPNFASMSYDARRSACMRERTANLLALQKSNKQKLYKQFKKNYRHTEAYIHLTYEERKAAAKAVARTIAGWGFARLFAECIDKVHFDPQRT
ncbi:MAG: DUF3800 domain-containing protein, partial [Burkholderiales bacterium]